MQSQGIYLANARQRIWKSLRRVDLTVTSLRWSVPIIRGAYWSRGTYAFTSLNNICGELDIKCINMNERMLWKKKSQNYTRNELVP